MTTYTLIPALFWLALVLLLWSGIGFWLGRLWQRAMPGRGWWLLWGSGGLLCLLLYLFTVGSPLLLMLPQQRPVQSKNTTTETTSPPAFILQLKQRLEENPNDIEALAALGEASFSIGRTENALDYYRRAVLASGGNMELIGRFAELQVIAAQGIVTEEAYSGFDILYRIQPENLKARFFLGLHAKQQQNTAAQNRYWHGLKEELPANHPWRDVLP